MMRAAALALAAAAGAGAVAAAGYGAAAGVQTVLILAPVGLLAALALDLAARRVPGLRRQLAVSAGVVVASVAVAVAVMVERMFVSAHDALFALIAAGWGVLVGGWAAWTLGRRALQRLAASERARRDLVAAVSHDLRTPITSLRLLAEAVDDEIVDPATRHSYVERMSTHVRALGTLIDDLFELSRLEAGDLRWRMEHVPVDELVAETVEAMRPQAESEGVRVSADVDARLGAARANPEQLQRVLFNLLQNAIRHTPADGSVVVRAEPVRGLVEIEVADTGDGIATGDADHVFEPFGRAGDREARTDGGAGLGLAIARAIVQAHGGRIWLADADRGTRVRFSLPAVPRHRVPLSAE